MKVWYLLTALVLVPLITSAVIGCSTPAPTPEPPKIEEGWVRLRIEDVGSIDYPSDFLELQSGDYKETKEEFFRVYDIPSSDFTLQQVGLNELKPSASEEYRRVVFKTEYLNPGEKVFRANEKYTMSQQELAELQNELIDKLQREFLMLNIKLVEFVSIEIKEVNGMFPLVYTYKRQLGDNPIVLVKIYVFWNYDKTHHLAFSYRVEDEEECREIYDKIIDSFRIQ